MPLTNATTSAVIVLGPAAVALRDNVERFLGFVLTPGGNYPSSQLDEVEHDVGRAAVLVSVRGPRPELDRLAYTLKTTFQLEHADLDTDT